jgi:hypothetical protein
VARRFENRRNSDIPPNCDKLHPKARALLADESRSGCRPKRDKALERRADLASARNRQRLDPDASRPRRRRFGRAAAN